MKYSPPLISGTLIKRYKRFLADIKLHDNSIITVSVPNTGSMAGLTNPLSPVWLSYKDDAKRKYPYRLEIVEVNHICVGINTLIPNKLAREVLDKNLIPEIGHYQQILPEQRYGKQSRIDFLLKHQNLPDCYLEVKNVHFIRHQNVAEFPDTVTQRGARHLDELIEIVKSGKRAIMLYVIQRSDCNLFSICDDLDPVYGKKFALALKAGVEAYAIKCNVTHESITPFERLEIKSS